MEYDDVWQKILKPEEKVIKEFSLGRKYILMIQTIDGLLGLLFLPFAWFFSVILFLAIPLISWYLRKANAYCFSNKRVLVHRGWLTTHLISVDFDKITDVNVREPFFERIFLNTGELKINTAGTGFQEIILTHIEEPYELKKTLDGIRETK